MLWEGKLGDLQSVRAWISPAVARYIAYSQAALDVLILNGNRLVASVGFTFFFTL